MVADQHRDTDGVESDLRHVAHRLIDMSSATAVPTSRCARGTETISCSAVQIRGQELVAELAARIVLRD